MEPKIPVQIQTQSSEPFITSWNKPTLQTPTMKATTPSASGERFKPAKSIRNSEQKHHDIFDGRGVRDNFANPNMKNLDSYGHHPARAQTFNIFRGY